LSAPASSSITPPSPTRGRAERILAYRRFWVLALVVFALDQGSKAWVFATLPFGTYGPPGAITVIDGFFYLVHVGNTGAAWSLFSGRSTLLAGLALVTLIGIYAWRASLGLRFRTVQTGFGLLCGGIVGNFVDRLLHGHVVDFIDLHFGSYVYPTFNIADAGICTGVGLYMIWTLRQPPPQA
jgi:signal peptidase II